MTETEQFGPPVAVDHHNDEPDWAPGLLSGWRWPATLLAIVAALAHVPVMGEHVRKAPYMGGLFALFSLTVLGLAAALLLADTALRYALLGGWCALALLTYVATRTIAVPQLADDVGNWTELWGLVSIAAELGVVACCTAAIISRPSE